MRVGPSRIPVLLALLVLLLPPRPAGASLEPGERAPSLEATAAVDGEAPVLATLRGRVVLLEFFSTACPHCQARVGRLNALAGRYGSRGLVLLAVTREASSAAERFRRQFGARYPILVAPTHTQRAYRVRRYPEACLLDPLGCVVWSGPSEDLPHGLLVQELARAHPLPALPAALAWTRPALDERRFDALRRALEPHLACLPAHDPTCLPLRALHAWIAWYGAAALAAAQARASAGDAYGAWVRYAELERDFGAQPEGRAAAGARGRLEAEPAAAREVAAGRALDAVHAAARHLPSTRAAASYRKVFRQHAGTQAAARAQRIVSGLDATTR